MLPVSFTAENIGKYSPNCSPLGTDVVVVDWWETRNHRGAREKGLGEWAVAFTLPI